MPIRRWLLCGTQYMMCSRSSKSWLRSADFRPRTYIELFPNKEEGRLYSKKLWRKPTDGNPSERRASHESLNRLVPGPIRRLVARFQRHLRGHTMETL